MGKSCIMNIHHAHLSRLSKARKLQVGAIIVKDNRVKV